MENQDRMSQGWGDGWRLQKGGQVASDPHRAAMLNSAQPSTPSPQDIAALKASVSAVAK